MKPNNPIDFRGIDHVVLRVSDVERSLHFYTEVLGAGARARGPRTSASTRSAAGST